VIPWTPQLLLVSLIVAGAAMLKGVTGFGFPLVAVPLLSTILGPRVAIPMLAIPTMLSNVIVVRRGGGSRPTVPLVVILAGLGVGTVAGALLIKTLDQRLLSVLVGAVSLLYVAATAFRLTTLIPRRAGERAAPVIGLVAGVIGGATGIFAPFLASYLHLLGLAKREFVFWITMMFFVSNIVQITSYLHLGLYAGAVWGLSLVQCVPMAVGTWSGLLVQDRLSPQMFNRVVLGIVFLSSLNLLAHGFMR